jgi:hypothetical protein
MKIKDCDKVTVLDLVSDNQFQGYSKAVAHIQKVYCLNQEIAISIVDGIVEEDDSELVISDTRHFY